MTNVIARCNVSYVMQLVPVLDKPTFSRITQTFNHNPSNGRFQKVTLSQFTCLLEKFGGRTSVLDGL
jgi:hypothetical protein